MPQPLKKTEWENFFVLGHVPKTIRQGVLKSWKRCRTYPIASRTQAPTLDEEALLTQRALSKRVRNAAVNALNKAGRLLVDTESMVLLSDRNGVIIDSAGDSKTLDRGRENHLELGGNWTEQAIGTNAIGTSLHLGQPVTIHGCEHYCEDIQRWNCAATPVRDPISQEILGVLDISWPNGMGENNAAALSASLAAQIETELNRAAMRERGVLMEHGHLARMRRGNDPILILDRSGENVLAFEDLAKFTAEDAALSELRKKIPLLIDQTPETISSALTECMSDTDFEVISEGSDAIGVMISLRRSRRKRALPGAELARIGAAGATLAELCQKAERLAGADIPVLIEGEAGVGKSFLAQALHRASAQANRPIELLDCAELTEESLLRILADDSFGAIGTLCLNGPGSTAPAAQKLLLRLVETMMEREVRIIALSSRHLYDDMKTGLFRPDLYYRIAAARLEIPPLRERPDEILPLLGQLCTKHAQSAGRRELRFTSAASSLLSSYDWPGNLLEMKNLVASLDALSFNGLIDQAELPSEFHKTLPSNPGTLRDAERARIMVVIDEENGNLSKVARRLGIARSTLYLKLDSYGIERPGKR